MKFLQQHRAEPDLALYAGKDVSPWRTPLLYWHVAACAYCRERAEQYRDDRHEFKRLAAELPRDLNWELISTEMTANVRVGLAAGECVASPDAGHRTLAMHWRVTAAAAGLVVLLMAGWWLNAPKAQVVSGQAQASGQSANAPAWDRAIRAMGASSWRGTQSAAGFDSPVVGVSSTGIELHQGNSNLDIFQGTARPVAVSLSVKGLARARYVDSETGQVTITSVYAQ